MITKDIEELGTVITHDEENIAEINKLVNKLEKDSMKIGESIYKKFDETEIDKREKEAKKMPSDDKVIEGLKSFV